MSKMTFIYTKTHTCPATLHLCARDRPHGTVITFKTQIARRTAAAAPAVSAAGGVHQARGVAKHAYIKVMKMYNLDQKRT